MIQPVHDHPGGSEGAPVEQLIAAASASGARPQILLGDPGSGKTHTLNELRGTVPAAQFVAHLESTSADRRHPLSTATRLVTTLPGLDSGPIVDIFREVIALSDATTVLPPPSESTPSPTHLRRERLLFQAARLITLGIPSPPPNTANTAHRLLLCDDIDLADELSQIFLAMLADQLSHVGIVIILTATRVPHVGSLSSFNIRKLTALSTVYIMSTFALRHPETHPGVLAVATLASGGNPGFVASFIASLDPEQLSGDAPLRVPAALLTPARTLLNALLGRNPTANELAVLRELATAHDLPARVRSGDEATLKLAEAGLIRVNGGRIRIASAELRAALWTEMDATRRQRTVEHLLRSTDDDPAVVEWLHSLVSPTEPGRAEALLAQAHETARARRFAFSCELAERALQLAPADVSLYSSLIDYIETLGIAGQLTLAERYLRLSKARISSHADVLKAVRCEIYIELQRTGRIDNEQVQAAIAIHGEASPEAALDLLATTIDGQLQTGDLDAAAESLANARALADTLPSRLRILRALYLECVQEPPDVHDGISGLGDSCTSIAIAQLAPPQLVPLARLFTLRDQYAAARRACAMLERKLQVVDSFWRQDLAATRFELERRAGKFQLAREAVSHIRDRELLDPPPLWTEMYEGWREASLGHLVPARRHLERFLYSPQTTPNTTLALRGLVLLGQIHLLTGDTEAAHHALRRVARLSGSLPNPNILRFHGTLLWACLETGRTAEAAAVLDELKRASARTPSRWGQLTITRSELLMAPAHEVDTRFATALAEFTSRDSIYERALTEFAYARTLARDGRRELADAAVKRAHESFREAGLVGAVPALRPVTPDAAREPGSVARELFDALTVEEQQIIQLVVSGLRSKEVAKRMFVSLRTVELRLTRIYRKCGVTSRNQLIALMHTASLPSIDQAT